MYSNRNRNLNLNTNVHKEDTMGDNTNPAPSYREIDPRDLTSTFPISTSPAPDASFWEDDSTTLYPTNMPIEGNYNKEKDMNKVVSLIIMIIGIVLMVKLQAAYVANDDAAKAYEQVYGYVPTRFIYGAIRPMVFMVMTFIGTLCMMSSTFRKEMMKDIKSSIAEALTAKR